MEQRSDLWANGFLQQQRASFDLPLRIYILGVRGQCGAICFKLFKNRPVIKSVTVKSGQMFVALATRLYDKNAK